LGKRDEARRIAANVARGAGELLPNWEIDLGGQMPLERTARGHRFDFKSRACVICGMTHKEFLEKGRPACMGHPKDKADQSNADDDPELA
jgi:hypothetical protein